MRFLNSFSSMVGTTYFVNEILQFMLWNSHLGTHNFRHFWIKDKNNYKECRGRQHKLGAFQNHNFKRFCFESLWYILFFQLTWNTNANPTRHYLVTNTNRVHMEFVVLWCLSFLVLECPPQRYICTVNKSNQLREFSQ